MINVMTRTTTPKRLSRWLSMLMALGCLYGTVAAEHPIKPGDRIAIVGNTFADQLRVHGYFETLLLQRTQGNAVSVRNLGWGGDMLKLRDRPTNFPSEESTLTAHQTDVIIACFGMGESFAGPTGLDKFQNDLEAFIDSHAGKKYNGESEVRLILISPIAVEDHGRRTPNREQRNQDLAAYTRVMGEVAKAKKVPFVNLFYPTLSLIGDSSRQKLTTNGIHLNRYGYWIVSRVMADALVPGELGWRLEIDASGKVAKADGVTVSKVETADGELHLTVKELAFPILAPPEGVRPHDDHVAQRDVVAFDNLLADGRYTLSIDGKHVVTASGAEWAKGIAIDASPTHDEAEAYRLAVNDKNQQFIYSWKALNQVHIVGERKKSPSGRALSAEIVEFNKLTNQRDRALRAPISLKTREWRLVPNPR